MVVDPVTLAAERVLTVPSLGPLLPGGGLRRGSTVAVEGPLQGGATSLGLALLAGPSSGGAWCAVAGLPELGLAAAAELGLSLDRLALVPRPGERLATVLASLIDGFDVVMARIPTGLSPSDARRLAARARQRSSVLVVLGQASARSFSAELTLAVEASEWRGVDGGYGHLRSRTLTVVVRGRRQADRAVRASLWLPAPTGGVALAEPLGTPSRAPATGVRRRRRRLCQLRRPPGTWPVHR